MKNIRTPLPTLLTATAFFGFLATGAQAAVVIASAGFEPTVADGGQAGTSFNQAVTKDTWIYTTNDGSPRFWTFPTTGGNPNGYASGEFGNSNSYRKALYQVVTDNKANTGTLDFTFDLNLNDVGSVSATGFEVAIWGANSDSNYTMQLTGSAVMNANVGDAVLLDNATYAGTTGWQKQTISGIDLGVSGYDYIIIAFKSNNYGNGDIVGIDNVAFVPEPSSFTLLGAGLAGLLMVRRRQVS